MRQRSALLQLQMVLALTLTLVLVLTLALAPSGMISKKGVPKFCPSTVLLLLVNFTGGKKKRTKRYPQNGANAPMVGANVPTEPQNAEKQTQKR